MWWTQYASRSQNIPVAIAFSGGTDTIFINQQEGGGKWNILGLYHFIQGASYDITITSQPGPASTCADAVRLAYASIPSHTITATSGANGSIDPSGTVTVFEEGEQAFTITPNTGFAIDDVLVDGSSVGAVNAYTFPDVTADHTIEASFAAVPSHTITATSGANGSIDPSGTVTVFEGGEQAFTITPNTGFAIDDVLVDGSSVGAVNAYTFPDVTADHTIEASFAAVPSHTITATSGANGSIDPSGTVTVFEGGEQAFTITPNTGFAIDDVLVDGSSVGAVNTYTFPDVTADHTIEASFAAVPSHTITATSGANGSIDPSGTVTVFEGGEQAFTITPNTGFAIDDVLVDGSSVGAVDAYTFPDVTTDHTIEAYFESEISVIIDNGDPETTNSGGWSISSATGSYGSDSLWSRDGSTYTWNFTPAASGYYKVSMWWTTYPSRTTSAPVTIEHADGTTIFNVNQQQNASQWNGLGTYRFDSGVNYEITITAQSYPTTTCADAVKLTAAPPPPPLSNEQMFIFPGYASIDAREDVAWWLETMGAVEVEDNSLWTYYIPSRNRNVEIRMGNSIEEMRQALTTEDAHVLYFGHSNYGLGGLFATQQEQLRQEINDIRYIDDDRIFNYSSKWVHVNIRGMRTSQAYPYWWPNFQDGTSGIMPYDFDDPNGDPAYNYYITYQVPGDSTHYKIENSRHAPIERFSDWGGPAWYSPDGIEPDPTIPDEQQYFITNPEPWKPSVEVVGDWTQSQKFSGYYLENYLYAPRGQGDNQVKWIFDIPTAGFYRLYAWWSPSSGRSTDAPYTIYYNNPDTLAEENTTVRINQRNDGWQWTQLGDEYYFDAGEHFVMLTDDTATGTVVGDAIRIEHADAPPEVLSADFSARVRSGVAPLEVTFSAQILGEDSEILWDFGDGTFNSTRTYISHFYDEPGVYTVTFSVSGPLGSDTVTKTNYIVVGENEDPDPILRAEFRSSWYQEGSVPFEARFDDMSSGNIVAWHWDFGDGTTSDEQEPTHTYTTQGIFTVALTVTDADGTTTSTEVKPDFIRVNIFDKAIDNVDYPKAHYRRKTLLFVKELDIDPADFKYSRLLYVGCDSGHYFTETFQRGTMFYSLNTNTTQDLPLLIYMRSYLEGKSDHQIWQDLQAIDPIFDYYYFDKPPGDQPLD
ncbi:hypothetical protein DSCW_50950 [Desulfosarcina widdelii]|uniref:PKD domain-containing protein n=1 Tax=Desulfosarcina widdelii TaxID=947919 RepID=A0A5K7Z9E9_9BACT|nr:PKD domain-containing protein [Desulfosarcina widdelii]BBO77678.1 hypothetical protein DSCW_50950 [Desulfosarcina widdelii]